MGGGHGGNFGRTAGMRIGSMEFINSLSGKRYSTEEALDIMSNVLTALSFIPGIDTFADLAAIPVDIARGDYVGAVLDLLGAVPILGEIADGAKTVDKVADATKLVDKVSDSAQLANKTTSTIQSISPYKITQTHKLTLSKKKYSELVESIRKNGITEPIKYVEHNGTKYVVDGHHRLQAAKDLKLKNIPVEKVSLPYKGYNTVSDLEWFE